MKPFAILTTASLPFVGMVLVVLLLFGSYQAEDFSYMMFGAVLFYAIPGYCVAILPWYFALYVIRSHFHVKAFYSIGALFFLAQPIIVAILLNVPIGSTYFWSVIVPILAIGLVVAMLCILLFYKKGPEEIPLN